MVLAPSAHALEAIPGGSIVRIEKISKADAYFKQRKAVVGLVCGVGADGLHPQNARWYGGALTCNDGTEYYFYEVAVELGDFGVDYPTLTGHALWEPKPGDPIGFGGAPADAPLASGPVATAVAVAAPPAEVFDFPAGKMVKVVDLAPADALHAEKSTLVGRLCVVVESPLHPTSEGHYAGRLFCDDGKSYQVFMAKVVAP